MHRGHRATPVRGHAAARVPKRRLENTCVPISGVIEHELPVPERTPRRTQPPSDSRFSQACSVCGDQGPRRRSKMSAARAAPSCGASSSSSQRITPSALRVPCGGRARTRPVSTWHPSNTGRGASRLAGRRQSESQPVCSTDSQPGSSRPPSIEDGCRIGSTPQMRQVRAGQRTNGRAQLRLPQYVLSRVRFASASRHLQPRHARCSVRGTAKVSRKPEIEPVVR